MTITTDSVIRYVITHVSDKDQLRTLTQSCQGRDTYPTREEAERLMGLYVANGLDKVLSCAELATLEVRPCECWPNHFDPMGIYFD